MDIITLNYAQECRHIADTYKQDKEAAEIKKAQEEKRQAEELWLKIQSQIPYDEIMQFALARAKGFSVLGATNCTLYDSNWRNLIKIDSISNSINQKIRTIIADNLRSCGFKINVHFDSLFLEW
jgi:hypothetical protein